MDTSNRNRSEGWKHAKKTGHDFEEEFARRILLPNDTIYKSFAEFLKEQKINAKPVKADASKGKERVYDFTDDGFTQSKADVTITLKDGSNATSLNISIKKPSVTHGQVHLSTLNRFLLRVQNLTQVDITDDVLWVFKAFTGETDNQKITDIATDAVLQSPIISKHNLQAEVYQNRLYITTIQKSYPSKWAGFKDWFQSMLPVITQIVFSSGYCKDSMFHANILYYGKTNRFFLIKDIIKQSGNFELVPKLKGRYAGSTLAMPWGYLQIHRPGKHDGPYQLQFHHDLLLITSLLENR
jgi:hypothetical protein